MAITTVYYRHKTDRGWRYSVLGIGGHPESAKMGPFFIRVRDGANKYKWQKHDSDAAATKAAELAPVARKAQELGLLPDDLTEETNKNRVPILPRIFSPSSSWEYSFSAIPPMEATCSAWPGRV